jgi:hypothetical protein
MKLINCLLLSGFTLGACFAQTITTVARTGDSGFSSDGGPAIMAQFSDPRSRAFDGQGNLYIVDNVNSRIRQLGSSGMITTVVGSGDYSSPVEGAATQTGSWLSTASRPCPTAPCISQMRTACRRSTPHKESARVVRVHTREELGSRGGVVAD